MQGIVVLVVIVCLLLFVIAFSRRLPRGWVVEDVMPDGHCIHCHKTVKPFYIFHHTKRRASTGSCWRHRHRTLRK